MARNQDYAEQLGRAWAEHRQGQNDAAIRDFSGMLQTVTDNMDALYGMGLAQRSVGQLEAAQASFERCLTQVNEALEAHPHEDRYQMLQRMTKQRLDELKDNQS